VRLGLRADQPDQLVVTAGQRIERHAVDHAEVHAGNIVRIGVDVAGQPQRTGPRLQAGLFLHLAQRRGLEQRGRAPRARTRILGLDVPAEPDRPQAAQPRLGVLRAPLVAEHARRGTLAAREHEIGDDLLEMGALLHVVALGKEQATGHSLEVDGARRQESLRAQAREQVAAFDNEDDAHGRALSFGGRGVCRVGLEAGGK
jgi:hypothetical protein